MSVNENDIAVTTRVRLARNIASIPYPKKMTTDDACRVVDMVWNALCKSALGSTLALKRMEELSPNEKASLTERHLISRELEGRPKGGAAIISRDESICIMLNEEDHIRIQVFAQGLDVQKAFSTAKQLDRLIGESIKYDTDEQFGFLTACPTNVGTGMRISVMLHLPGISASHRTSALLKWAANLGMTVRGLYGEGTKASGALYQLSNQITLGISEDDIASKFSSAACGLISEERRILADIYEKNKNLITDKCLRSLGILKNAYMISSAEAMDLISNVCMGSNLGIIKGIDNSTLRGTLFKAMPAGLALLGATNGEQRDIRRAQILQTGLIREEE